MSNKKTPEADLTVDTPKTMTPQSLRAWRKGLGWKQKEAAEYLGLKKRMIQYYEKGDREGKPVEIPRTVRLACYALSQSVGDFDGETPVAITLLPPTDEVTTLADNVVDDVVTEGLIVAEESQVGDYPAEDAPKKTSRRKAKISDASPAELAAPAGE